MKLSFKNKLKNPFKSPFPNNRYVVLADSYPIKVEENQIVDVILSPRYYWVKKEKLPVRYEYQAKAYAESSFDGVIPEGHYTYLVQKDEDEFWLYAYDDSFIINELAKLNLKPSQIGKVYFAQAEFKNMQKPIDVNEHEALTNHDGSIIKVPKKILGDTMSLSYFFSNNQLSNFSVNLNKFSKIIDFKKAYILAGVLGLLSLFYLAEFIWLGGALKEQNAKQENIAKTYKLPKTSIQTKALIKQLDKKMKRQLAIREKLYTLTKSPLSKDDYFTDINFKDKRFKLTIVFKDDKQAQVMQKYLDKHFKIDNVNKKDENTIFEVHYD